MSWHAVGVCEGVERRALQGRVKYIPPSAISRIPIKCQASYLRTLYYLQRQRRTGMDRAKGKRYYFWPAFWTILLSGLWMALQARC